MILAGAKKALLEGYKVEVVRQSVLDGVNAQISWCHSSQSWIVSSNQFALMLQNVEQAKDC